MSRRLWVIYLTIFLDLVGFGLVIPAAPYYAESYGANDAQVVWLMGVYSLMQFLLIPVWGRVSDRVGRRPVLLLGTAGAAVGLTLFGAATSLAWLFFARALHGAMTANISTATAYIVDATEPDLRSKAMGLVGAAFGLGFVIGPLAGGLLSTFGASLGLGYSLVGYGGAALSVINFIVTALYLPESLTDDKRQLASRPERLWRRAFSEQPRRSLLLVSFVTIFAFANMTSTYALLTMERFDWRGPEGARNNGWVFFGLGLIAILIQGGMMGRLARRFGERKLVVAGLTCLAAGMVVMGLGRGVTLVLAGAALLGVGNSLSTAPLNSLVSFTTDESEQGAIFGVKSSLGALGRFAGPLLAGVLYEKTGSSTPYLFGASLLVVALLIFAQQYAHSDVREASLG